MASIKDVAKRAGVGASTVSRALNKSGYVSPQALERIEKSIRELNYVPNELARNLFHNRTGIVALLVPMINHPFFSSFIHHFEAELAKRGYKMMLCDTSDDTNLEAEYLSMLSRNMVDGVISGVYTENTEPYAQIDRPIVAFDRYLGAHIPMVRADHMQGGRLAAEALIQHGCKCVLHFGSVEGIPIEATMPFKQKDAVFERCIRDSGIGYVSYENKLTLEAPPDELLELLLMQNPRVDGVFASDNIACSILRIALRLGLRVPQDLAIVSYDGMDITAVPSLSITCVVQPLRQIAEESIKLLIDRIEGQSFIDHVKTLPVYLRQGQTT